jgi:hypothetical protein
MCFDQTTDALTILSRPQVPYLMRAICQISHDALALGGGQLTDEVIEPEQGSSELAVGFHDDPYTGANTSVDQL